MSLSKTAGHFLISFIVRAPDKTRVILSEAKDLFLDSSAAGLRMTVLLGSLNMLPQNAAYGAAAVEGRVQLPAASDIAAPANRYELKNKNPIGPPPEPVAVVYLEGAFAPDEKTPARAVMNQENYQFLPGMLAVQTGATVEFPNRDDDYHSIFSYSKAKRFDLGRYRKGEQAPSVTFDRPGVIKTYCEIHEHMQGTIVVLDTPYFTNTSPDGRYRLENLPAGQFTLKVWLDKDKSFERPVILKEGETLEVNFPE